MSVKATSQNGGAEVGLDAARVLVLPELRLLPAGYNPVSGKLKFALLVTPDACMEVGGMKDSHFSLQNWPLDIFAKMKSGPPKLRVGIMSETDGQLKAIESATLDRSLTWPARDWTQETTDQQALAKLWTTAMSVNEKTHWSALATLISASQAGGNAPDALTVAPADLAPDQTGVDGQIKATDGTVGAKNIEAIADVPHSDLALGLEFQRVEELLDGLKICAGIVNAREVAEQERMKRVRTQEDIADVGAELTEEECRAALEERKDRDEHSADVEALTFEQCRLLSARLEQGDARLARRKKLSEALVSNRKVAMVAYETALTGIEPEPSPDDPTPCMSLNHVLNTKKREEEFEKCCAAHHYASWPQYKADDEAMDKTKSTTGAFETSSVMPQDIPQNYFALQTNPTLSRLFGLAFDLEIDPADLEITGLKPAYLVISAEIPETWRHPECGSDRTRAVTWTLTKLRQNAEQDWHFWPATVEEANASLAGGALPQDLSQFDATIVMGAGACAGNAKAVPRFDLSTMDVRSATEMEMQRRTNREANMSAGDADVKGSGSNDPNGVVEGQIHGARIETAGLSLMWRTAKIDAARRLARQKVTADGGAAEIVIGDRRHLVLDADDVTIGFRLNVGTPKRGSGTDWRPLMRRDIRYGGVKGSSSNGIGEALRIEDFLVNLKLARKSDARSVLDMASLAISSRLVPTGGAAQEAFLDQNIAIWNGGPMGVDCSRDGRSGDPADCLPFGRTLDLPKITDTGTDAQDFPPRLRYGWPYRFALTPVYSGGIGRAGADLPDEDAEGVHADVSKVLFYPPKVLACDTVRPFFRALRQSRISAPQVLLPSNLAPSDGAKLYADPMGFAVAERLVVRTIRGAEALLNPRVSARKGPDLAQRVVIPPGLPFEDAACHGQYDDLNNNSKGPLPKIKLPEGALQRVKFDDTQQSFPGVISHSQIGSNGARFQTYQTRSYEPRPEDNRGDASFGDGIFEMRSGDKTRKSLYFPDAAVDFMAIGVRYLGTKEYLGGEPILVPVTAGPKGREIRPLVISLKALSETQRLPITQAQDLLETPGVAGKDIFIDTSTERDDIVVSSRSKLPAREVRFALAEGEIFELDVWCVPSPMRLAREFSLVQALATKLAYGKNSICDPSMDAVIKGAVATLERKHHEALSEILTQGGDGEQAYIGPGGAVAPSNKVLLGVAQFLHAQLACQPLEEISAVRRLEVVHACNLSPAVPNLPEADHAALAKTHVSPSAKGLMAFRPAAAPASEDCTTIPDHLDVAAAGSTHLVMTGEVEIDLNANDGLEIIAETVLPGTSTFDDATRGRSFAKKRANDWPRRIDLDGREVEASETDAGYVKASELFGFSLAPDGRVTLPKAEVTLLKVEDIAPSQDGRVALRALFEERHPNMDDKDGVCPIGRARISHRHHFPDGKARRMRVRARAISRTSDDLQTIDRVARYSDPWVRFTTNFNGLIYESGEQIPAESLPPEVIANESNSTEVILPATIRPAKCDARAPVPVFSWTVECTDHLVRVVRQSVVRIPLGREWFSSGEDEKVGLVLWPPDLKSSGIYVILQDPTGVDTNLRGIKLDDFVDDDLGPGGAYVTRRGSDPVRSGQANEVEKDNFLTENDLPDLECKAGDPRRAELVQMVEMPLIEEKAPDGTAQPKSPPMLVALATYEPRFDPVAEDWFVDVTIDSGESPEAFVRLGLVRYQPHTVPALRASRPVVQWVQPMPARTLEVTITSPYIRVEMTGRAASRRKSTFLAEDDHKPQMQVQLIEEWRDAVGRAHRRIQSLDAGAQGKETPQNQLTVSPVKKKDEMWSWAVAIKAEPSSRKDGRMKLMIQEVEIFEAASFEDEDGDLSKHETQTSGPRFSRVVDVTDLIQKAAQAK